MTKMFGLFTLCFVACTDSSPPTLSLAELPAFDHVLCGTTKSATLHIANTGDEPLDFNTGATVVGVTVTPAVGTVMPSAGIDLAITATAAPTAGTVADGMYWITTNDPKSKSISIPLAVSTAGSDVTIDASKLAFGKVAPYSSALHDLEISTIGTEPVTLALSRPALDSHFEWTPAMLTLRPTDHVQVAVLLGAGGGPDVYSDKILLTIQGELCNHPPASITMSAFVWN